MDRQTNTNRQNEVIQLQETGKENWFIWLKWGCKKPRYQQANWNFLNPHVSHQHPTLTKYFASNCAAEVFLSLLLWSYDVWGCFHWLCADSSSSLRSVQKKTPVKPQRRRSELRLQDIHVFTANSFQSGRTWASDREVNGSNPLEDPGREKIRNCLP